VPLASKWQSVLTGGDKEGKKVSLHEKAKKEKKTVGFSRNIQGGPKKGKPVVEEKDLD